MVKFIPAAATLALRSAVLRKGKSMNECVFETDFSEGAFHLAYYVDNEIVTIASFFENNYKDLHQQGYQLRGMATAEQFIGRGYAKELLQFAINHVKKQNATHIWCNARTAAIGFYLKMGFEPLSPEFNIIGVGPHYEMIFNIQE